MSPVLIVISLISSSIGALLAKSRNRTPWKGAIGGALPITLLGMIIFLKTKGERTKKNRMIDRIIVITFITLIVGGAIFKQVVHSQMNDTMAKYGFNQEMNKMEEGNMVNYAMYHDTFIIEYSVEEQAKEEGESYFAIEELYRNNVSGMSQIMMDMYKEADIIEEFKSVGYTSLQVRVLYRGGTTEESELLDF